jgi:hypothetical protein
MYTPNEIKKIQLSRFEKKSCRTVQWYWQLSANETLFLAFQNALWTKWNVSVDGTFLGFLRRVEDVSFEISDELSTSKFNYPEDRGSTFPRNVIKDI